MFERPPPPAAGHALRVPSAARLIGPTAAVSVFLIYLSTLAPGLTWANDGADGGDLITAAARLGVAHPSGYPTYLVLARLFLAVPFGPLALRTNVFSAVSAALAAGVTAVVAAQAFGGQRRYGYAGGLVAGLAFGLSPLLWSQAVITEVHALHALFLALILYTLPLGAPMPTRHSLHVIAGVIFGLALGNHLTMLLLLPPWLAVAAWERGQFRPGRVVWRMAGLASGLLIYAYLPWRASAHPPVNWGDPSTLAGLWWVVSGAPYRALAFGLPSGFVAARLQGWASLIMTQFGLLGMLAAFYGLFFGAASHARVKTVTIWLAVVFSIFAIGYNTADSYAYLLPAILAMAIWLGLGLATALAELRGLSRHHLARLAVCAGLLLAIMLNAVEQLPHVDASRDTAADAFGEAVMDQAPARAVILTHFDKDTFSAWYYHFALGRRQDAAVVVEPLLAFAWYRKDLLANYPGLRIPEQMGLSWRETLLRANTRPVCDTQLEAAEVLRCEMP